MLRSVRDINEEIYKRFDFHRLLRICQRFGGQRDELKRNRATIESSDTGEETDSTVRSTNNSSRKRSTIASKRKRTN